MLRLLENRRVHVVFGIEKFPNIHAGGYSRYKQIDYGNVFGRYRGVVVVVVSFARVSNARARHLYSRRPYTTAESRQCFYLIFRKKKKNVFDLSFQRRAGRTRGGLSIIVRNREILYREYLHIRFFFFRGSNNVRRKMISRTVWFKLFFAGTKYVRYLRSASIK